MSKEIERLKSKMEFYKSLINLYDVYDKIIEDCQDRLTGLYKRIQELKEGNSNDYE